MSDLSLEKLINKYYGYVTDPVGSDIELLDLFFVRDAIQHFLEQSMPEDVITPESYSRIYDLDNLLWNKRVLVLNTIGEATLQNARHQQHSPRVRWWWYLDELTAPPSAAQPPAVPSSLRYTLDILARDAQIRTAMEEVLAVAG